jgi:UDPglucose 6-dehydrogenase
MQKAKDELPDITYCLSHYEAAQNADAILVLTEWDEFRSLDWDTLASRVAHPLIIDGRNLYTEEEASAHGFQYVCIGKEPRPAQLTHAAAAVAGNGASLATGIVSGAPISPSLAAQRP